MTSQNQEMNPYPNDHLFLHIVGIHDSIAEALSPNLYWQEEIERMHNELNMLNKQQFLAIIPISHLRGV
jgi:hypothetical protein